MHRALHFIPSSTDAAAADDDVTGTTPLVEVYSPVGGVQRLPGLRERLLAAPASSRASSEPPPLRTTTSHTYDIQQQRGGSDDDEDGNDSFHSGLSSPVQHYMASPTALMAALVLPPSHPSVCVRSPHQATAAAATAVAAAAAAQQLRNHMRIADESVRAVGGANEAVAGFRAQLEAQLHGLTQQAEGARSALVGQGVVTRMVDQLLRFMRFTAFHARTARQTESPVKNGRRC